jgi:hypothetical protein
MNIPDRVDVLRDFIIDTVLLKIYPFINESSKVQRNFYVWCKVIEIEEVMFRTVGSSTVSDKDHNYPRPDLI